MEDDIVKSTVFTVSAELLSEVAMAGSDYANPLLSWLRLIFSDDKANSNGQGIKQEEFSNLIMSMVYMPIKADYKAESGLEGHTGAYQIGVIKEGQQEGNKLVAIGALYNDEFPEVVDFFKKEIAEGRSVDFSWEIRYKDSVHEEDANGVSIEWLTGTTTKAITAVGSPAYDGRTPLLSISSIDEWIQVIDNELAERELVGIK